MNSSIKAVIVELKSSFSHVPRPKAGEWYERSYPDPELIENIFISQELENITLSQVWNQGDVVTFLKPMAFLYFLPRLAELCLEDTNEAGDLFHSIEFRFRERPGRDERAVFDSIMTPAMQIATTKFIQLFYMLCPAFGEIKQYWLKG